MDFFRYASTKHKIIYTSAIGLLGVAVVGSFMGIVVMELLAAVGIFWLARYA